MTIAETLFQKYQQKMNKLGPKPMVTGRKLGDWIEESNWLAIELDISMNNAGAIRDNSKDSCTEYTFSDGSVIAEEIFKGYYIK